MMKSPYFPDPVVVVSDQEAYKKALKKWNCLENGIAMFSERELVWLGSTMDLQSDADREMLKNIFDMKVKFHGSLHDIPKDFDHDEYVLKLLGEEGERIRKETEEKERSDVEKRMDKLRRAANG